MYMLSTWALNAITYLGDRHEIQDVRRQCDHLSNATLLIEAGQKARSARATALITGKVNQQTPSSRNLVEVRLCSVVLISRMCLVVVVV